jgi:Flp pilus assembly protein TadB
MLSGKTEDSMKKATWLLCLAAVAMLFVVAPVARAARSDEDDERADKMSRRLRKAQEQIQHMQQQMQQQMQQRTPPMPGPLCPSCAMAKPAAMRSRCLHGVIHAIALVLMIVHIILAVWVYSDVQKRGVPGRGIFIVLVLLAGVPMSILYALVRIGDKVGEKTP